MAGLLEVRGLGIVRLPHVAMPLALALVVELGRSPASGMPDAGAPCHARIVPLIAARTRALASAPERVALALDCALGRVAQVAGAFAA